ncbi:Mus7/MMS22 family-domain-containing protein [Dichomitus squalens]|uniref:Mus7/MMS22 family-domain-containing protein n=1 Tax=Dichomitus squalens TaxID=114155 RepID=A0A4Q9MDD7_9APHY|nr:Mus7/MMS22 family-domain-containing protein [Dichomitus squalens]
MAAPDDIVDTSDPEELEELAASKPEYWLTTACDIAQRRDLHKRVRVRTPLHSPRKRRKLDLSPEDPPSPLQLRTNLPGAYPSPHPRPKLLLPEQNCGAPLSSPTSYVIPSPSQRAPPSDRGVSSAFLDHGWPETDEEGNFVQGSSKLSTQREVSRKASTRSPSPSPDPLLLFTPPRRRSASPAQGRVGISSPASSPLTPASSPTKFAEAARVPSSSPSQTAALSRQQDPPLSVAEIVAFENAAAAAERARYSLRARNARQLNPYEYDKLLYKRQMRAAPEAIVKVVSPPRPRRRQRSKSANPRDASSGAEDEYQVGEDEDDEESQARRRRKGKGREEGAENGGNGEEGTRGRVEKWLPEAFRESSSSSEDDADILSGLKTAKTADKEHRRKRPRPFPMKKTELQRSVSPSQPHDKSPSPFHRLPPHPKERPKPRPRARERTPPLQPDIHASAEDDDDELLAPAPTWRRRRSVTFFSPKSSPPPRHSKPLSPWQPSPRADAVDNFFAEWAGGGDDDYSVYGDIFARAQSPFALPATPATELDDPMSGASSEHRPPPTSSEPNDIMDITSDTESRHDDGSRSDWGFDSESSDDVDRRRRKILGRMMPAVMIKKIETAGQARKAAAARRDSASVEREQPLLPGQSRRRIGSRRSVEIVGDSESSDDVDMRSRSPSPASRARARVRGSSDQGGLPVSDSSVEVIEPIGHQPRPKHWPRLARSHVSVSDEEDDLSSGVEDVEEAVGRWVSGAKVRRRARDYGEVREGDLIDRMLSRTNLGSRKTRKRRNGAEETGIGGQEVAEADMEEREVAEGLGRQVLVWVGNARLDMMTAETDALMRHKVSGSALQRRVRNVTAKGIRRCYHSKAVRPRSPRPGEVHFTGDEPTDGKGKRKQKAKQVGLYVFKSDATHLVSGRSNAGHVTIEEEVPATCAPSGWANRRGIAPRSRQQRQSTARTHSGTLENFWTPGDDQYEHDGFVVSDREAPQQSSQDQRVWKQLHRVTVDFDIKPFPAGIAFPNATYLGHGWLHELITLLPGIHEILTPPSCSMFDCYIHADMSILEFTTCLEAIYDQLRDLVLGSLEPADYQQCQQWQAFLHSISQHLSYFLAKGSDDAYATLATNVEALIERLRSLMEDPTEIIPDDEVSNPIVLQVLWFLVEASCRIACDQKRRVNGLDGDMVKANIIALMGKLWDFTFGHAAVSLELTREGLTDAKTSQQIAELWICLLNLTNDKAFQASLPPQDLSFWTCYLQVLQTRGLQAPQTDLKARETIWRSLFTLCVLSQFSIHGHSSLTPRLPPSWRVVAAVLERAPLTADPEVDASLTHRILRKRDEYVRVLVTRCLWLHLEWHWRLDSDDVPSVFNRLLDVFKTRRFASLTDEASDAPSFLRDFNLSLLREKRRSDTAFTLFLKLVVRAADDMRRDNPQVTIPAKLKKILSLAVPVGSVPFTKAAPASSHALSMLFNRFSAVAVAIYLEPTVANVRYRLSNARRYVAFKDTDNETRRACIRGAMYLAILLRHLSLPLADVLEWLTDMTNVLLDEYQAIGTSKGPVIGPAQRKEWVVTSVDMLLRSIHNILKQSSMDPERAVHKYPDPALLQGPWVTRVFSTTTNLSTNPSTGDEIRRFVQAFLDARARVIPPPRRPQRRPVADDSQESQDDYGQFDLDLDDPELLAALGEDAAGPSGYKENKEKEQIVCEIIDKHISPAIYRLLCKYFNDPVYQESGELSFKDADEWVDCWVGCASVMVQNGKKDWNFYFQYGAQSWEHIMDPDGRRRIGLRFMYMLLQLDPPAYLAYTEEFMHVLFKSMATQNITLEHDYASLLFSIDRLHHPLLSHLPINPPAADGDYHITKHVFVEKRPAMLESLINTMKDICESLQPGTVSRATYIVFCIQISDIFTRYPILCNHHRLTTLTTWLRNVS